MSIGSLETQSHTGMAAAYRAADERIVLRPAGPADAHDISRLAQLDSTPAPSAPLWLAVLDGTPVAAYSPSEERAIADPWQPTARLVALLELMTSAGA